MKFCCCCSCAVICCCCCCCCAGGWLKRARMESFDILVVVVDDVVSDLEFWFPKPFESRSNKLLSLLLEITIVKTVLRDC